MLDIKSPCIRNCCLDQNDVCLGCFRSVEEIMHWSQASNQQKRQVMSQVAQRKNAIKLNTPQDLA